MWGGGQPGKAANTDGAAYDPAADSWRSVADSPVGLNLATGAWTGREMIVFGSLLDHFNRAATRRAVGAAYDPATDSWRELPPSPPSPQASSGGRVAGRFVAWDHGTRAARSPVRSDSWRIIPRPPMSLSVCYPDSAVFDGGLFAFLCGHGLGLRYTRADARTVAEEFMRIRLIGGVKEMHALISRGGKRSFGSPASGLRPLYDRSYDRFRILFVRGASQIWTSDQPVTFDVGVRVFVKTGRSFTETLSIGTGRSIDGRTLDLVVNGPGT